MLILRLTRIRILILMNIGIDTNASTNVNTNANAHVDRHRNAHRNANVHNGISTISIFIQVLTSVNLPEIL